MRRPTPMTRCMVISPITMISWQPDQITTIDNLSFPLLRSCGREINIMRVEAGGLDRLSLANILSVGNTVIVG